MEAILLCVVSLVALAQTALAVLVVLRYQKQLSYAAELLARTRVLGGLEYVERATGDAAAAGREPRLNVPPPAAPPAPDQLYPKIPPDLIPTSADN